MSRDEALDPRLQILHDRRTSSRLAGPGPAADELAAMLDAADTAPDHGRLRPWRFKVLDDAERAAVAEAYATAQRERSDVAELVERAASKPLRGPCVVVAFSRSVPHPKIPEWEQLAASAAATQNLCLAATALGYGSAWRTGWFIDHPAVRSALGAGSEERVIGLVHLGTPVDRD